MNRRIIPFLIWLLACSGDLFAQVAVIAHKDVPVDQITPSQLMDLYTGDVKHWGKKRPVIVFNLKPRTAVKDSFYKLLGRTSSRMKSIWMKKMLTGEGDPPESLPSETAVLHKVASTPGAIGFVSRDSVNANVKTLIIKKGKNWPLF